MIEVSASDQYVIASADSLLLDIYDALPAGLYPPFPPLELPGGLGGLVSRGGFAQTVFFGAEVLGLTFITPSGRRVVTGGRTVKNVQGYDLTRPFIGSFGHMGRAETITLRLRPGLNSAHHCRPASGTNLHDTRARFLWQHGDTLHAFHYGHVREVEQAMQAFGGEPVIGTLDYRPLFLGGMGIGEGGPLRDRRFRWADGGHTPEVPALFARVMTALS